MEGDCNGNVDENGKKSTGSYTYGEPREEREDRIVTAQLLIFGIRTKGLTTAEKQVILAAAKLSGKKLSNKRGDGVPPDEAFRDAHGPILVVVNHIPFDSGANCETQQNGTITCELAPNMQNTLHEFGHVFDNYFYKKNGEWLASDYVPEEWNKSAAGYMCDKMPCLAHSTVDHPVTEDDPHGLNEEFADMYMNWVLDGNADYPKNGFADDDVGGARRNWMDGNMLLFLQGKTPY